MSKEKGEGIFRTSMVDPNLKLSVGDDPTPKKKKVKKALTSRKKPFRPYETYSMQIKQELDIPPDQPIYIYGG